MFKTNYKNAGQAATELAVFGSILIFILGTILRTALGNSLTQNANFNAMRMALLGSWNSSENNSTARNSASILIVQDRLSPDFNKYGDLDRNAYIANGSGSFTYQMLYPLDMDEISPNLPIMDVYVNGQYFPFTTANFMAQPISPGMHCTADCLAQTPQQQQCLANQIQRNNREWVPAGSYPGQTGPIKLFYSMVANTTTAPTSSTSGSSSASSNPPPTPFVIMPPTTCNYTNFNTKKCKDMALFSGLALPDAAGAPYTNDGAMQFDLLRMGDYAAVDGNFPIPTLLDTQTMRNFIAWQWSATAGTTPDMIGLDTSQDQYPTYDIDGRLKEVTIYSISGANNGGNPYVQYEDYQAGDIDSTWDTNSCGPKPGLQNDEEVLTFTKNGTYLTVKDGQMYNPETGQVVRSVDKRNTIDLIQREIQLSNNTGRFCTTADPPTLCQTNCATPNSVEVCVDGSGTNNCFSGQNLVKTCYDTANNMIYVRSRIEDRRGHYWITNASGQLQIQ